MPTPQSPQTTPINALHLRAIGRDRNRFWFWMFLLTLIAAFLGYWHQQNTLTQSRQFILMDPAKTLYLAESQDLNSSTEFHASQAILAMEALFDRDPNGPDHKRRLELLFNQPARAKAKRYLETEAQLFRERGMHQKLEAGPPEILQVHDRTVRVSVDGQLIRSGVFHGQAINEVIRIQIQLTFIPNPLMLQNGLYPTVVQDFVITSAPPKRP